VQQAAAGASDLLQIVEGADEQRLALTNELLRLGRRLFGADASAAQLAEGLAKLWRSGNTLSLQNRR
jgi:hypothetical protein